MERIKIAQNTAKTICSILVRRLSWFSLDLEGLISFDFLFAISHFVLTCLWMEVSIASCNSSSVAGFIT